MVWGIDIEVLFGSKGSYCTLWWTIVMVKSMGTKVNSALMLQDVMTSWFQPYQLDVVDELLCIFM